MRLIPSCLAVALLFLPVRARSAQQDFSKVEVTATRLGEGVHVLFGAGGNIGVSSGKDGVFLIDEKRTAGRRTGALVMPR